MLDKSRHFGYLQNNEGWNAAPWFIVPDKLSPKASCFFFYTRGTS